jgi:hypothetical protein
MNSVDEGSKIEDADDNNDEETKIEDDDNEDDCARIITVMLKRQRW